MAERPSPGVAYIRSKLYEAAEIIRRDDDRTVQERLRIAYVQDLSLLEAHFFPHSDAQDQFRQIQADFNRVGEMTTGAGSMPTTLWLSSDAEAEDLAARVLALADRYLA